MLRFDYVKICLKWPNAHLYNFTERQQIELLKILKYPDNNGHAKILHQ